MRLILPKKRVDFRDSRTPIFFLAGPILGARDWQADACGFVGFNCDFQCNIANPRRYPGTHPFWDNEKETDPDSEIIGEDFPHQTAWEAHYLELAGEIAERGCIIFWLPCESMTNPRADGNPYSMDTRGEIGEWRWRKKCNPGVRIVIGAEENFPGLRTIRRNTDRVLGSDFPIYTSFKETMLAACKIALT